jgi:aspartate beta-hydroxylase
MTGNPTDIMAAAAKARSEGRSADAVTMLQALVAQAPDYAPGQNSLGLALLEARRFNEAIVAFRRAALLDPKAPPIWLNLADAYRAIGKGEDELASLDQALAIDPYILPALLKKAQALERIGRVDAAVEAYSALLAASPDDAAVPEGVRNAMDHGREIVRVASARKAEEFDQLLAPVFAEHGEKQFNRVRIYAQQRAGTRKVYHNEPTAGHFPFLVAFEFFDSALFPWFAELEQSAATIRAELQALLVEDAHEFRPYVGFEPTQPVNQWKELNHSPRWSAWFFWKDGLRQDANCARCPATAKLLDGLPLLDLPGKGPSVMFSVLAPKTRIPPHTGSSNVRTTVHLPLIVPPGCGFRVGGETREWREGEAWAFDDTIEHEAWNDSDEQRIILILDAWNPLLTDPERAAIRAIG